MGTCGRFDCWFLWGRSVSLRGQGYSAGVGHPGRLQVLEELGEPALGGVVVLETCRERAILQLVGKTLSQRFSSPEGTQKILIIYNPWLDITDSPIVMTIYSWKKQNFRQEEEALNLPSLII